MKRFVLFFLLLTQPTWAQTPPVDIIPDLARVCAQGCTAGVQIQSTVATGTAPFSIASTTLNTNLNADLLDGQHGSYYAAAADYLKLDQTTPQTVVNGLPAFREGLLLKNSTTGIGKLLLTGEGEEVLTLRGEPSRGISILTQGGFQVAGNISIQANAAWDDEYSGYPAGDVLVSGGTGDGIYPPGILAVASSIESVPAGARGNYALYVAGDAWIDGDIVANNLIGSAPAMLKMDAEANLTAAQAGVDYLASEVDPAAIHKDGSTVTTSSIGFREGVYFDTAGSAAVGYIAGGTGTFNIYGAGARNVSIYTQGASSTAGDITISGNNAWDDEYSGYPAGSISIQPGTGDGVYDAGILTLGSFTGLLKGTSGVVSAASGGTDYEYPLTFSYPLTRTINAIGLGYNSTNLKLTSNELNTIQDIATTSSPTFDNLTVDNYLFVTDILDPDANLNIHLEGGQMSFAADTFQFGNVLLSMNEAGYEWENTIPDVAAANGKVIFNAEYIPTVTPSNTIANAFSATTDLKGLTPSTSSTLIGNQFRTAYEGFDANTGFINTNYTGTSFSNTISGNYSSGMRMQTMSMTGVKTDVTFDGAWGGFGANFFPILTNITFSANTAMSHQIIGHNQTTTFNSTNDNSNQFIGFQSTMVHANAGAYVAGAAAAFKGTLAVTGTDTLIGGAAIYDTSVSGAASAFNSAIRSGKELCFYRAGTGNTLWNMAARNSVGFHSDLPNYATNFAFISDGAAGWMAADNSSWIFGAGKDASIGFDGNSLNIIANLITAADALEFTAGSYKFQVPADTDLAITLAGTTNSGIVTWMEDEDYFKLSDNTLIDSTKKVYFRDTAIYAYSGADGYLNLVADTGVTINSGAFRVTNDMTIGDGLTSVDYALVFDGDTADGVLTWIYSDGMFDFSAPVKAGGYYSSDGTVGYTGSCADGTALTVKDGLITGCS